MVIATKLESSIGVFEVASLPLEHFSSRGNTQVKALVMQCIGVPFKEVYGTFDEYKVGPHYFVPQATATEIQNLMPEEFGEIEFQYPNQVPIIQFISPEERAWSVGKSNFANFNNEPGCENGLNSCTISISFHSPGYANGDGSNWYQFAPYTEEQEEAGLALIGHLTEKYDINSANVLAHSTISACRFTSPGQHFFWKKLHEAGYGYLPEGKALQDGFKYDFDTKSEFLCWLQDRLLEIGFNTCPQTGEWDDATKANLEAFVLQYAQDEWEGLEQYPYGTLPALEALNGFDAEVFQNLSTEAIAPEAA